MIGAIRRAYHRWKSRTWTYENHTDCVWMMGPCDLCRHRIRANGCDPDRVHPLALESLLPAKTEDQ